MNEPAAGPFREPGVWQTVFKLLRLRLRIAISEFRRAKLWRKLGQIALVLLFLFLAGMVFYLSILVLDALRSPELALYIGDTAQFLEIVPAIIFTIAIGGVALTSLSALLQTLYLSGDMDFLMSAPVPIRAVFLAKMIGAILPVVGLMSTFALPVLFGMGISAGYGLLYYPLVLVVLAVLTLAAAGLAGLLVMAAVRVVPARRLAEGFGFVVGISAFSFSQAARFMNFDAGEDQVSSLLTLFERFSQPWSPLTWAGRGLVLLGKGEWLPGLGLLAAALALAGGAFFLSLQTAERLYYTGWASLQNNSRRVKVARVAAPRAANPFERLLPQAVRALVVKDWILYRRDLRSISKLITPLIFGVIYAIGMLESGGAVPAGRGNAPEWFMTAFRGVMLYGDVALALFVGWMLASNLAGLGVSLEGKSFWMIKAAPLSARQFLTAKYLVAYLPSLAICVLYLLVLEVLKGADLWSMAVSLVAIALLLAGVNGIYLAFGVLGAKFNWEVPTQMGGVVGCLGSLAGMTFLPFCFMLFTAPPLVAGLLDIPIALGQVVGLGLGGGAGIAGALIPLVLVERRVERLNEF